MSSTFSGDETVPFFGSLGAVAALVFSCMGAAYGTAKSRVGVKSMGVMRPELVMKSIMLVVMADVLGIYDLISSGFLNLGPWDYSVTVTVVPLVIFLIYVGKCVQ